MLVSKSYKINQIKIPPPTNLLSIKNQTLHLPNTSCCQNCFLNATTPPRRQIRWSRETKSLAQGFEGKVEAVKMAANGSAALSTKPAALPLWCVSGTGANKLRESRARLFSFIQDKKSIIGVGRARAPPTGKAPSPGKRSAAAVDGSACRYETDGRACLWQFLFTGKSTLSSLL